MLGHDKSKFWIVVIAANKNDVDYANIALTTVVFLSLNS